MKELQEDYVVVQSWWMN